MEKRSSRRLIVFFHSVFCVHNVCYKGFIGNISSNGMYARIRAATSGTKFSRGMMIELKCEVSINNSKQYISRVAWSYEMPSGIQPGNSEHHLGLEITHPWAEFSAFYFNEATRKLLALAENMKIHDYDHG